MSFSDFLRGKFNSTNLARSAGAPMAANMPNNVMARNMFGGGGRFPRIQALGERLGQVVRDPLKVGLISSLIGSRPDEFLQVTSQYQDALARREATRRQFEEIEQRKREADEISAYIKSLATPQGGQSPLLNNAQADFLSRAAQANPQAAMGMLAKVPGLLEPESQPDLSDAGTKARELRALGHDLSESQELELYGLGADATEDDLDKVLSTSDLESYRTPDGQKLPPGSTLRDAMEQKALPYSASEITQQRAEESGAVTLKTLKDMAIGDNGVFIDNGGGAVTNTLPGRLVGGLSNATGTFFGTEASRNRDRYNRLRTAYISSLARSRGESGSLSDGDIERISNALPELGAAPMTEDQARAMFAEAEKIYLAADRKAGARSSGRGGGEPIDLGGGVSLSF